MLVRRDLNCLGVVVLKFPDINIRGVVIEALVRRGWVNL